MLRYALSALVTVAYLLWRRPRAVIATNPPVFCALAAYPYCRLTGAPLVLDSHPTAFGAKGNRAASWMLPVSRWLSRRAAATLVTTVEWVEQVEAWGGRALIVHEAPAGLDERVPDTAVAGRALFVGVFASDEPVAEVVDAARRLSDHEIQITGRLERAPAELLAAAPDNVHFVGWLDQRDYRAALRSAGVVVALTTEPTSVMRSAYEAVYAGRPLVVSDWPALRDLFPDAIHVDNRADAIARGIREATELPDPGRAVRARARQLDRWDAQLAALSAVIRR